MAMRWFNQFRLSLEKQVVDLYAKVTIGAAGAPTLVVGASKGVASVAKNAAGKYTLTLSDQYYGFLGIDVKVLNATSPAAPINYVVSQAVTSATPTVVVQFLSDASVATDPANGEALYFQIKLKNSSAY